MNSQGKHSEHQDPLDDLLRRYLLENDPETEDGVSLLDLAGERVLSMSPTVMPSPEREAAMVDRLKERFPEPSEPLPEQDQKETQQI